jgi:hypothetical protein
MGISSDRCRDLVEALILVRSPDTEIITVWLHVPQWEIICDSLGQGPLIRLDEQDELVSHGNYAIGLHFRFSSQTV